MVLCAVLCDVRVVSWCGVPRVVSCFVSCIKSCVVSCVVSWLVLSDVSYVGPRVVSCGLSCVARCALLCVVLCDMLRSVYCLVLWAVVWIALSGDV